MPSPGKSGKLKDLIKSAKNLPEGDIGIDGRELFLKRNVMEKSAALTEDSALSKAAKAAGVDRSILIGLAKKVMRGNYQVSRSEKAQLKLLSQFDTSQMKEIGFKSADIAKLKVTLGVLKKCVRNLDRFAKTDKNETIVGYCKDLDDVMDHLVKKEAELHESLPKSFKPSPEYLKLRQLCLDFLKEDGGFKLEETVRTIFELAAAKKGKKAGTSTLSRVGRRAGHGAGRGFGRGFDSGVASILPLLDVLLVDVFADDGGGEGEEPSDEKADEDKELKRLQRWRKVTKWATII